MAPDSSVSPMFALIDHAPHSPQREAANLEDGPMGGVRSEESDRKTTRPTVRVADNTGSASTLEP